MKELYITWEDFTEGAGTITNIYEGSVPSDVSGGMHTFSEIPTLVPITGMNEILRINLMTGELYYDYERASEEVRGR